MVEHANGSPSGWERPDAPLGTLIYRAGLVGKERLEEALAEGQRTGRRLGEVLLQKGWIDEKDLTRLLAGQRGLPFVSLRGRGFDPEVARLLPERVCRFHNAMAIEFEDDELLVAVGDPTDDDAIAELRSAVGRDFELVVAMPTEIRGALETVYAPGAGSEPASASAPVAPPAVESGLRLAAPPPVPASEPTPPPAAVAPEPQPPVPPAPADPGLGPEPSFDLRLASPAPPVASEPEPPVSPDSVEPGLDADPPSDLRLASPAPAPPEPSVVPEPVTEAQPPSPPADPSFETEPSSEIRLASPAGDGERGDQPWPDPPAPAPGPEPMPAWNAERPAETPAPAPEPVAELPAFPLVAAVEPAAETADVQPTAAVAPDPDPLAPVTEPASAADEPPRTEFSPLAEPTRVPVSNDPAPSVEASLQAEPPAPVGHAEPELVSARSEPETERPEDAPPSVAAVAAPTPTPLEEFERDPAPPEPLSEPAPAAVAAEPAGEPPVEAVTPFRAVLRIERGEDVVLGEFAAEADAEEAARAFIARLARADEWPLVGRTFVRPDRILAVAISERREDD